MGSFSIWHWIVLLILVLAIYGVYRLAKRPPTNESNGSAPVGVGGWLLFLVAGLMILGPLMGAGRLNADMLSAESQYPNLKRLETWATFKSATWWTYLVVACLSFYAGLGLARGRDRSVVRRAIVLLWVIGPAGSIFMGLFIPLAIFGKLESDPTFLGGLFATVVVSGIWTAYLTKSRRVRATYGSSSIDA